MMDYKKLIIFIIIQMVLIQGCISLNLHFKNDLVKKVDSIDSSIKELKPMILLNNDKELAEKYILLEKRVDFIELELFNPKDIMNSKK